MKVKYVQSKDVTKITWHRGMDSSYIDIKRNKIWIDNAENNLDSIVHEINEFILHNILTDIADMSDFAIFWAKLEIKPNYLEMLEKCESKLYPNEAYKRVWVIHLISPCGKNYTLTPRNLEW